MVQFIFKHKPQQKLHGIVVGSEAIDAQIKDVLRISIRVDYYLILSLF